jgi:hypothetical protein
MYHLFGFHIVSSLSEFLLISTFLLLLGAIAVYGILRWFIDLIMSVLRKLR